MFLKEIIDQLRALYREHGNIPVHNIDGMELDTISVKDGDVVLEFDGE